MATQKTKNICFFSLNEHATLCFHVPFDTHCSQSVSDELAIHSPYGISVVLELAAALAATSQVATMSHHPSRKPPVRPNRRAAAAAAAAKAPVPTGTDWKKIGFTGVGLVILTAVAAVVYQGYLETRVVTPYSQKKLAAASFDTKMLWGSYRPGEFKF